VVAERHAQPVIAYGGANSLRWAVYPATEFRGHSAPFVNPLPTPCQPFVTPLLTCSMSAVPFSCYTLPPLSTNGEAIWAWCPLGPNHGQKLQNKNFYSPLPRETIFFCCIIFSFFFNSSSTRAVGPQPVQLAPVAPWAGKHSLCPGAPGYTLGRGEPDPAHVAAPPVPCRHALCPSTVPIQCAHALFPCSVLMQCAHALCPYTVPYPFAMHCAHAVCPCSVPMHCAHVPMHCAVPCAHALCPCVESGVVKFSASVAESSTAATGSGTGSHQIDYCRKALVADQSHRVCCTPTQHTVRWEWEACLHSSSSSKLCLCSENHFSPQDK
jgi:hypothetical protein